MFFQTPKALLAGLLLPTLLTIVQSAPTYTPIQPPSYPLAVRNPYLSAWMPGRLVDTLPSSSPQFWTGANLTWSVFARVDGKTYNLFGVPAPGNGTQPGSVVSAEYTSTHTLFKVTAGSATFRLDFFSPVSPANYVRQSLPFSYLTVSVCGTNVSSNVQLYSDIDDTWTGQSTSTSWNYTTSGATSLYQLSANGAATYSENNDQALWGQAVFASRPSNSSKLSTQSGPSGSVRSQFAINGTLTGQQPPWTVGGVVALAHDLGTVSTETSVTFAVGYVREEAVNYLGNARTAYYRATYRDTPAAVTHFLDDYSDAHTESQSLDTTLAGKASASAGSNYSDIVTLSTRQVYGALDLTIPNDSLNTNDTMAFIKEISSDGNVNTVDVIFPAYPIFFVMDPEYIRLLLEPVVQYLATGRWKQPYVIHDIGGRYPNATGHDDQNAEAQPIEETGNLLILAYAYAFASGNKAWATKYIPLFQGYADYLVKNGLNIPSQISTDDGAGALANQTNLAIKAAVGLNAFGQLSGMKNYSDIGAGYATQLYDDGLATDANKTHFTLVYGNATTFTTAFNLFPDVNLKLHTFNASAFDMQSAYYPSQHREAGVPLDSRVPWGKTDWMHFAAAYCRNDTKSMFINDVHGFVADRLNDAPFSDRYFVTGDRTGRSFDYRARPTVGGHFAVLAMDGAASVAG